MRIILITILLLLPLTAIAEDEVVLPFDYFYGRWVEGHYFDGFLVNSDLSDGDHGGNYSYTNSFLKLDIVNLQDYLLFSSRDDSIITPLYSIAFRPTANWQVSVEGANYQKVTRKSLNVGRGDEYTNTQPRYSFSLLSRWHNHQELVIKDEHASYNYFINPFFAKKNAAIKSRLYFRSEESSSKYYSDGIYDPSNDIVSSELFLDRERISSQKYLSINNEANIGLTNSLNLSFQFDYSNEHRTSLTDEYYYTERMLDSLSVYQSKRNEEYYYLSFRFTKYYKGFYLSTGIGGSYNNLADKFLKYYDNIDSIRIVKAIQNSTEKARRAFTRYYIAFEYVSRGEFNPEIILADYNNHYYHLLAHKQFLFQITGDKTDNLSPENYYDYGYSFELLAKYGLFNFSELWMSGNYKFENYDFPNYFLYRLRYEEHLGYTFGFRLRTYLFDRANNDWHNDTDADIMFGHMPDGGEVYFALEYSPKRYHSDVGEHISLFTFANLRSYGESILKCQLTAGFGHDFDLKFAYNEDNYEWNNRWVYDITLSKRIKERLQLRVRATADEFDWFDTDLIELYGGVRVIF